MESFIVVNDGIRINVIGEGPASGDAMPIVCVHGWPELAYSWRHQIAHFASQGRRIVAMDVRGYGGSDKPNAVADYTMSKISADVAAVIDAVGGKAILFGHDWGAPIVWQTSLRHVDKVAAVAGLSVPYRPMTDTSFLGMMRKLYEGRFFYQLYFQEPGVAEAEFGSDPDALAKIYHGISGAGMPDFAATPKAAGDGFLTGMAKPDPMPEWMTEADLAVYQEAFRKGGWTGPLNRYRAQDLDYEERAPVVGRHIVQPSAFIAGTLDPVRRFIPGIDGFENAGAACDDFRGTTLIEGVGHWVQQEAPEQTNEALNAFVDGL